MLRRTIPKAAWWDVGCRQDRISDTHRCLLPLQGVDVEPREVAEAPADHEPWNIAMARSNRAKPAQLRRRFKRGLLLLATRSGSVYADESVVSDGRSQEYKVEEPIALSRRRASAHCQPQRPPHGDAKKTHLGSISNSHQALSSLVVHRGSKSPLKDLVPAVVGDAGNMRQHRCFGSLDDIEGGKLQPICLDELSAIH